MTPKRTFIEEARRAQIIEATIDVLAEQGYVNTSFVRIAKHAGISPSLIPYHFENKEELTDAVLMHIMTGRIAHMAEQVATGTTPTDKLRIALEADLAYMGTRPRLFAALVEVFFSVRDSEGHLRYIKEDDDPGLLMFVDILNEGQQAGEFGEFDAYNVAQIIVGAREQFLAQQFHRPTLSLDLFTETLVLFVLKAVQKEATQ
ncbi:MAG: TetR/AcrR family transcriptional regulator [Chloroflexota bacterium]